MIFWKWPLNTSFRIPINKRQWLTVYIWHTQKRYDKETAVHTKPGKCAIYVCFPNKKRAVGEFGLMHFSHKYIGAGCVAHEIQHFMFDWIRNHAGKVNDRNEERLAQLADDVTRIFWSKYYGTKHNV